MKKKQNRDHSHYDERNEKQIYWTENRRLNEKRSAFHWFVCVVCFMHGESLNLTNSMYTKDI